MKIAMYVLAAALFALGLVFVVGSQGMASRIAVGVVLGIAGGVIAVLGTRQATATTVVQKLELSGDVHAERITCTACDAPLSKASVEVKAGAVFVSCEHCGATYQLEEEPKW